MRVIWTSFLIVSTLTTTSAAQEVAVNGLVFHGVNRFVESEQQEAATAQGMSAELKALRIRLLTAPPQAIEELKPDRFFDFATRMAERYDIPQQVFHNLIAAESNWDPVAVSYRGAVGLTQLMPSTAVQLGVNPWNALQNMEGGARYLRQQHDRFGTWELALAAYNAGPGTVERYGGVPPYEETQNYVKKILGL